MPAATPSDPERTDLAGRVHSLRGASGLILLAQVAGNVGFFVAVLVLARTLEPHDRGVIAFVISVALILPRVFELGIGNATTVLVAQRGVERRSLLSNAVLFSLGVAAFGSLLSALLLGVADVGPSLDRGILVVLAVGILGNALLDCGYAFLLGVGFLRPWTLIASVSPWLYATAAIVLAAAGELTVFRALLAWSLTHLAWGVAAISASARGPGFGRPQLRLFRDALSLGVRAWVGSLSRFLNFRLDQVILGLIATQATLGVYAVAVNLSEVALYVPGAVVTAAVPAIARVRSEDRPATTLAIYRPTLVVTAAIVAAGALIGTPLLPVVFGDAYSGSVTPYLWLLPGALGFVTTGVFGAALLTSRRPLLSSAGQLTSLVVGVALDFVLIPPFGASGAAAAAAAAFCAGGAVAAGAFSRISDVPLRELLPRRADVGAALALVTRLGGALKSRAG
jgi:O-antigen/teichoic acid export membrane protein